MTEYQPIGSIAFLVNIGKGTTITDEDLAAAQSIIIHEFENGLARHGVADMVRIDSVESRRGCIIITINISVMVAVATSSFAIIEFFRHYPQVRRGIVMTIRDLNMARIRIAEFGERLTCVFRTDIPGIDDRKLPPDDTQ